MAAILSIIASLVWFQPEHIGASGKGWCGEDVCVPANYNKTQRPYDNMNVYLQLNEVGFNAVCTHGISNKSSICRWVL